VVFYNQHQIYELYVKQIYQSDLYGFIEVEHYQFDERSGMIVDPNEERLKNEFSGVKRTYIPMHSIVRIDEVEKQGVGKISDVQGDKVTPIPFPSPAPTAGGTPGTDS
jgi:hypothetical protein